MKCSKCAMKYPNNKVSIKIIIATSNNRTSLLINRSLKSIYNQKGIDSKRVEVIVVDDNVKEEKSEFSKEYTKIVALITELRKKLGFDSSKFKTTVIPNSRTPFNSGTGAWNTGMYYINENSSNAFSYTAILDDDDEYKDNYLQICFNEIVEHGINLASFFAPIIWKELEFERIHYIEKEKLTPLNFFIGNPGVQGSNMFFRSDILYNIYGFDETLPSTTDRDLMIRFIDFVENNNNKSNSKLKIRVWPQPLVVHHAYGDRVTTNMEKKKKGLDLFYSKYKNRFSDESFQESLIRAKNFFGYEYGK